MRRRPAEPLAMWVAGAFTLLLAGSFLLLGLLAVSVVRSAWPGPLEMTKLEGRSTCFERMGSNAHGTWIRKSGYADAWLVPSDQLKDATPASGHAALLLHDGRWLCTQRLELLESGRSHALATREFITWVRAFQQDQAALRSKARDGDTIAIGESRRLYALGKFVQVRLSLEEGVLEIPIQDIRTLRPEAPSTLDKFVLLGQTLRIQLSSAPGSFASLIGTALATLFATLLASPLAIAAAIWLSEFSRPGLLSWCFHQSVQLLAGIPPVVFGAFGLVVLIRGISPHLSSGIATPSLFWASLTLTFLALPTVTRQAHIALRQVPPHLREASLCAGATRLQTLRRVVLPAARPGLWAAILMGSVQALAETAPLLLTGAVQLAGHTLVDGTFPWLHPTNGFEHLGSRIYHGIEQFPPGPLGIGAGSLACLLLAASAIALRTWAASLRHPRDSA